MIIDHKGNILWINFTSWNIDDRQAVLKIINGIKGRLFGDTGYFTKKLSEELLKHDIS